MKEPKTVKARRSYDADFKQEVTRMLVSGRSTKEVSESFGIAEKRYAVAASLSLEEIGNYEDKNKERAKPG